jgi:hypothetical protein
VTLNSLLDILGWSGATAVLVAYALVSNRTIAADSIVYQALNLAGAALLLINSFFYGAYPSVGVNMVWVSIALLAILRSVVTSNQR